MVHLGSLIKVEPPDVADVLLKSRLEILGRPETPTLNALVAHLKIKSGRTEEGFRWSLSLYADGDTCPLDVRRYPAIFLKP